MAEAYGNVVQHWQSYMKAYVVSETATTATIRCESYFHSIKYGFDTACVGYAAVNGQWVNTNTTPGSRVTASSPYGGSVFQHLINKDLTVSKNGSGYNIYCQAKVQLFSFEAGVSNAGVNVWVPAITYSAPPKPSNLKVERISDTQHKLTWTNGTGQTAVNPMTGVYVYRHTDGGDTETLYSSSVINAFTDGTTAAGHMYDYDVRDFGPGGRSDMSNAVKIYTSPLAPGTIGVTKTDAGGVLMVPSSMPKYYDAVEIERSTDSGKTWESVTYTENDTGYLDPKPPAGVVRYRVRGSMTRIPGTWAETSEVVTICPPNAPTVGKLANVYATGTDITVTWVPNHPDWTEQSSAQVEVTRDGTATVYSVTGSTSSYTIAKAANGSYTVRVRTKGQDPDWGEWSGYASFTVAAPPAVSITAPAASAVIDMLPISVSWTASDSTGITSQTVKLLDSSGSAVASLAPAASDRTASLTNDYDIRNKSSYTLVIRAYGGSGLYAEVERAFATDWKHPDAPTITLQTGSSKGMSIGIAAAKTVPLAVSFDVVRVLADGSRKTVASGVNDGASVYDSLPPLNTDYSYEVTSYAESGALLKTTHAAIVKSDSIVFNFGADASTVWLGHLDPDWSRKVSHQVDTYHFFNGSELPTAWVLGETDVSDSYSFSVLEEAFKQVDAISKKYYEGWVRDLYGERYFAVLEFSTQRKAPGQWSVSVSATRTAWEEPNG